MRDATAAPNYEAQRLNRLRKEAGLTFGELGDRVGLSASYVGNILRDEKTPARSTVQRIKDELEEAVDG